MYNFQYTSSKTHVKGVRSREEGRGEWDPYRSLIVDLSLVIKATDPSDPTDRPVREA